MQSMQTWQAPSHSGQHTKMGVLTDEKKKKRKEDVGTIELSSKHGVFPQSSCDRTEHKDVHKS